MRILICDDHRLFAQALAVVLTARDAEVVGCVSSPAEAVETVSSTVVDVCLMDIMFPEGDGVAGTARVAAASPRTKVVILSGNGEPRVLAAAVEAGARGVVSKNGRLNSVVDAVDRVHAGELVLDSLRRASDRPEPGYVRRPALYLTAREREVVELLVKGSTTADIAQVLGVKHCTARSHIQSILNKLGLHSKLEVVAFAVNNRLVPLPQ